MPAARWPPWGFGPSCELYELFRDRNKDEGEKENLDRMELSVLMTCTGALFV